MGVEAPRGCLQGWGARKSFFSWPELPPRRSLMFLGHCLWRSPWHRDVYTPARKDDIHFFGRLHLNFQLHKHIFLELISPKLHYTYSFVIQRITWKEIVLELFLGKSHVSYINACFFFQFRNNFRLECNQSIARQEIALGKPLFLCEGWRRPLHRKILGRLSSLPSHKTHVAAPRPFI